MGGHRRGHGQWFAGREGRRGLGGSTAGARRGGSRDRAIRAVTRHPGRVARYEVAQGKGTGLPYVIIGPCGEPMISHTKYVALDTSPAASKSYFPPTPS